MLRGSNFNLLRYSHSVLNQPRCNAEWRCGRTRPRRRREREKLHVASSRLQERRRPEGAAPRSQPMMMIDAGRTHTPQPLSKIKSLFCKVVKEQNGTGLAAPLSLTAGVPFSVFSIINSSGSRQRDSYTPLTRARTHSTSCKRPEDWSVSVWWMLHVCVFVCLAHRTSYEISENTTACRCFL